MKVYVLEEFTAQYKRKDRPKSDFTPGTAYKVHKFESYSESGNGYVVLVNDAGEIWWVNNQHVRDVKKYRLISEDMERQSVNFNSDRKVKSFDMPQLNGHSQVKA